MKPIVVSDVLAVGEVPSPEQMEILAKAGFKSVINNQPDGEVARFPGSAALAGEAKRNGLAYVYAPIASRTPTEAELLEFAKALKVLPGPIYGFCYSGARSAAACAYLLTETMEVDAIIGQFAQSGFDIANLKPWLEDERKRRGGAAKPANGGAGAVAGIPPAGKPQTALAGTPTPAIITAPRAVEGIVVHARAMGNGGFAM